MKRTLHTMRDVDAFAALLRHRKLPVTVTVETGRKRTTEQNALQRLWVNEAAEQLGDRTAENVRGWAKLHHGVPILRAENDDFRARYDEVFRPLSYETKLALMEEPFDFPVTRLMNVSQKVRYLDAMHRALSEMGVTLTDPDALKYAGAA